MKNRSKLILVHLTVTNVILYNFTLLNMKKFVKLFITNYFLI